MLLRGTDEAVILFCFGHHDLLLCGRFRHGGAQRAKRAFGHEFGRQGNCDANLRAWKDRKRGPYSIERLVDDRRQVALDFGAQTGMLLG